MSRHSCLSLVLSILAAYRAGQVREQFQLLIQPDTGHEFTPRAQQIALAWLAKWPIP